MRDYSKVAPSLWTSRRFAPLPRELRLLYLYLLTNPHGNSIGCFRLPIGYIQTDLRVSAQAASKQVYQLADTGLIRVYEPESLVQIDKFLRHSPIANVKHACGAAKTALGLPECLLKVLIIKELLEQKHQPNAELLQEFHTCIERVSNGCTEPVTETETETETKSSVPNGTGGTPPENQKSFTAGKAIFDTGKALLATAEKPPKNPGAVINAWLRDHGDAAVWSAMLQTGKQGTPDPIAYMNGCLKNAGRNGRDSQAEDAASKLADEILDRRKAAEA